MCIILTSYNFIKYYHLVISWMLELLIPDTLETSPLKQKPYSADLHASGDCMVVAEILHSCQLSSKSIRYCQLKSCDGLNLLTWWSPPCSYWLMRQLQLQIKRFQKKKPLTITPPCPSQCTELWIAPSVVPLFCAGRESQSPEAYMNTKNQMELFQKRAQKQTKKSEIYILPQQFSPILTGL